MSEIIAAEGLTRAFGNVMAVDHVSFSVKKGEIFGFLGPNGAGKTTTVRLLCGLIRPDDGKASVDGHNVATQANEVRSIVGLLPEPELAGLYERMTPLENLEYFARLYGVPESEIKGRERELLDMMELWPRRNDRIATFSRGMRQKVSIARAIINDPQVLFMDEPTTGLDPATAKSFRDWLANFCKQLNRTVFLCTHNLPEAESICDRIAIINKGKIATIGGTRELEGSLWKRRVFTVTLLSALEKGDSGKLAEIGSIENIKISRNTVRYETDVPNEANPQIIQKILQLGGKIVTLQEERKTLEDVYLKIVGQADESR
ncbi:MAG: ABC transporter ATP-binding protein [Promethearchaeati archaeon SRVP18_Atabeyarchaeia-1]